MLGADPGATEDDADEREDEDSRSLTAGLELSPDEDPGAPRNSEYVLRVRVSDPSTASATVNVIVRITEVNEPPAFKDDAPTLLSVDEIPDRKDADREDVAPPVILVIKVEHSDKPIDASTYAVTDQDGSADGPDDYDPTIYTYSVSGTDGDDFVFNTDNVLTFKTGHEPDFEDQSSYSITVVAHSGEGSRRLSATLDVTIEVVDGDDAGAVVLSQRQPEVGIAVHATASDDDGGVTIKEWVWQLSEEVTVNRGLPSKECVDDPGTEGIDAVREDGWTTIAEATSAVYIPKLGDVGRCLRATAMYTDNVENPPHADDDDNDKATGVLEVPVGRHGSFDSAPASDGGFVNAPPVFPDQDFHTEGDQSDRTSREVAENTETGRNIGAPVSAQDEDDDLLIYTLSGADAASFGIGRNNGQLNTKAPLNYEVRNSYTVVVTATDPFGATDSIQVTINVTDEDDPAEITVNTGENHGGP